VLCPSDGFCILECIEEACFLVIHADRLLGDQALLSIDGYQLFLRAAGIERFGPPAGKVHFFNREALQRTLGEQVFSLPVPCNDLTIAVYGKQGIRCVVQQGSQKVPPGLGPLQRTGGRCGLIDCMYHRLVSSLDMDERKVAFLADPAHGQAPDEDGASQLLQRRNTFENIVLVGYLEHGDLAAHQRAQLILPAQLLVGDQADTTAI
jgi:hypothetical protein